MNAPWIPDQNDGTYRNPVLYADYSDPDVVRHGDDFYMVASSFNCMPGLPILHSRDLVNWTLLNHVYARFPLPDYDQPQHGKGAWAPSIRFHAGKFWVFFSSPDEGIWMCTADDPAGAWSPLHLVRAAKGWIDPCPFWDDDGQAYLVHAFARSRAGIKDILFVHRMSPDGTALLDEGQLVFDGTLHHPTMEGPKLYKRNGYYYIFTPAGGVPRGWQTILRSRNIQGPYEDRIVLAQGRTAINGPHQGGWVDTAAGEDWFLHFQDCEAYGRVVHLQPMGWRDDWPWIGEDEDGDGVGQPVLAWRKPGVPGPVPLAVPATSDDFQAPRLGLQWQWHANPRPEWYALPGHLRLFSQPAAENDLLKVPNLLLQKFPADCFTATTRLTFQPRLAGERAGLVVMGKAYAGLVLVSDGKNTHLVQFSRSEASLIEQEGASIPLASSTLSLRVAVSPGAVCRFSYSLDDETFLPLGDEFTALPGVWIGAKVGLFACAPSAPAGFADVTDFNLNS
jgi:beta-xylosidase